MAGPRQPRKKQAAPDAAAELRRQAEERLDGLSAAAAAAAAAASPAPEDLAAAVHELRVHQIELEMQNEELRRAQLELEAQREKYFALFDRAPVGYLTIGDKGIVGDANFTAARLLGVERQMLVGQPFSAFVIAADRDAYYLHLRKLEKTEAPQSRELRLQRVGAGPFWARIEGQPRRGADGETLSFWVTFTDISARKRAEEALLRSEEQLARAVEGSGVGLWDWHVHSGEAVFNERWAEIVGYTLAELAPLSIDTWTSLCDPDDLQRSGALLEQHFSRQAPIYECEAHAPQGRPLGLGAGPRQGLGVGQRRASAQDDRHASRRHRAQARRGSNRKHPVVPAGVDGCDFLSHLLQECRVRPYRRQ